jgi:hypothetical protein
LRNNFTFIEDCQGKKTLEVFALKKGTNPKLADRWKIHGGKYSILEDKHNHQKRYLFVKDTVQVQSDVFGTVTISNENSAVCLYFEYDKCFNRSDWVISKQKLDQLLKEGVIENKQTVLQAVVANI